MTLRNLISRKLILPLSDLILKRSISKKLHFLEKSQFWTLEQLENFQNERLRILIEHVYKNVPYYTNLFQKLNLTPNDIQCKADLVKLPIMTKEEFKKNFPENMAEKNLQKGTFIRSASSGSTGEPLQYYLSKEAYSMNIACGLRAWSWMGYILGDKYIKISQNQRKTKEKKLQDIVMNNSYVYMKNIDEESLLQTIAEIQKIKPKVLRCYPDPLEMLADIILEKNIQIKLLAVASTGSNLHPHARVKIEKAFQCKVYDGYSCEGSAPFFQCENHDSYHASMEYGISEFVEVEQQEKGIFEGRHIATNLWNFATPFIRYDSQDILEWEENKSCSCGRDSLTVKRIIGRDNDVLITPNGKKLIVQIFVIYFSKITPIKQFQIQHVAEDEINMLFVVDENFTDELKQEILTYWTNLIADADLKIEIVLVDSIQSSPRGKRRFVLKTF
ncbi:MAG: phenylacetate--CoA ligase family protein [Bacteroidota bacterium]